MPNVTGVKPASGGFIGSEFVGGSLGEFWIARSLAAGFVAWLFGGGLFGTPGRHVVFNSAQSCRH